MGQTNHSGVPTIQITFEEIISEVVIITVITTIAEIKIISVVDLITIILSIVENRTISVVILEDKIDKFDM